jgi:hypothetical protein
LSRLVDEALRRKILTLAGLARCVSKLERIAPGRAPMKVRTLLAKRIPGYDPGDSDLETVVYDFHRERRVFDADRARSNDLVDEEWRPLHFTSTSTKDDVVRKVASLLVQSFPHRSLSQKVAAVDE